MHVSNDNIVLEWFKKIIFVKFFEDDTKVVAVDKYEKE